MKPTLACLALTLSLLAVACAGEPLDAALDGPGLAVNVAALNLAGVGDVVWDLEVRNGASTPQVVWQRRVSSSGYGDGAGSASYIGTCDASANPNTVRVWVVGVYSDPVDTVGSFASGATGGASGNAVGFENPTAAATPLERTVACSENTDVAVQFDVALMRPAQQGFFDITVNFNDVFCSAKFDCCTETTDGTACASDIELLFDATGARASTMVLGLACTAGTGDGVQTELYLDPLALDCTSPSAATFDADITLNPAGAPGNQCTAGATGMHDCTGVVTELHGVDADTYLFQLGVYRGVEQLTSGGLNAQKVYWNVALGVKRPAIQSCWLATRATADDALGTSFIDNGTVAAGAVYPYLQWEVDLAACKAEPLTFGSDSAMVRTAYTRTGDPATGFAYGFGPSLPAGSLCTPECQHSGVCVAGTCDCTDTGYDGAGCATDRDECALGTDDCDANATCANTPGSFTCTCNAGFVGDGTTCDANGVVGALTAADPGQWADASLATSCETYIRPAAPRVGSTTSGVYRIDPDGGSATNAFDVYCDMTTSNGGWTMLLNLDTSDGHVMWWAAALWKDTGTYGDLTTPFGGDHKSPAYTTLSGTTALMLTVHQQGSAIGWKAFNKSGTGTLWSYLQGGDNTLLASSVLASSTASIWSGELLVRNSTNLYANYCLQNAGYGCTNYTGGSPDGNRIGSPASQPSNNVGGGLGNWGDMGYCCAGQSYGGVPCNGQSFRTTSEAQAGWASNYIAGNNGTFGTDSFAPITNAQANAVCSNAEWANLNGYAYDYAVFVR